MTEQAAPEKESILHREPERQQQHAQEDYSFPGQLLVSSCLHWAPLGIVMTVDRRKSKYFMDSVSSTGFVGVLLIMLLLY